MSTGRERWRDQWENMDDAEKAFPSEWRAQCQLAEDAAVDADDPPWVQQRARDEARIMLWLGVYERDAAPRKYLVFLTHSRKLECPTDLADCGAIVERPDGTEAKGFDVYVLIPCATVRRILARGR